MRRSCVVALLLTWHTARAEPTQGEHVQQRVDGLYAKLEEHRFAAVPARELWSLLAMLGANTDDQAEFAQFWRQAVPQRDEHSNKVYPHKGTLTTYFDLDVAPRQSFNAQRSSSEVATRLEGHVIEHIDPTTANADNASYFRIHKQWPAAADMNSVFEAVQRLVFLLMRRHAQAAVAAACAAEQRPPPPPPQRQQQGDDDEEEEVVEHDIYEAMFSAFRVQYSATEAGEPGPEGIHQDSAELTVVLLVHRGNVAHGSGANRVWSLAQPAGKPTVAELEHAEAEGRLLLTHTLLEPFDALFMLDREVKHEACPIAQADATAGPAIRDVLTVEVRRPRPASADRDDDDLRT
jgi:hypothetical protein